MVLWMLQNFLLSFLNFLSGGLTDAAVLIVGSETHLILSQFIVGSCSLKLCGKAADWNALYLP